jgi:hypothetical protein
MPTSASATRLTLPSARGAGRPAEISAIPPLLARLDESAFAAPPQVAPTPVPEALLPRLLQAAGPGRARRRWLTTGLGLLAAAFPGRRVASQASAPGLR